MSQGLDDEETEGKLFFKFSEPRVPCVIREVLVHKGWREWDPDKHPESLWSLHWKSGRFKLSDWDRCDPHFKYLQATSCTNPAREKPCKFSSTEPSACGVHITCRHFCISTPDE
jgi:hypothetical protein